MIDARELPEPTSYPPGSAGKIAELERRAALGLELWHPKDNAVPVMQMKFAETKYPPVDYERVKALAIAAKQFSDLFGNGV
ncbi:MAG: hypothetical protein ACTHK7_10450 [Aureliella sp.]